MSNYAKFLILLISFSWLTGCVGTSPTEEDFGNSVGNIIAKQQMTPTGPLKADEPIESGNGRRLENVNTIYQTNVGDPSPVVRQVEVESQGNSK
jgi:hypothetical protein